MTLGASDAIARHMQWKMTLQFAVEMREGVTAEQMQQITSPNLCAIGKWLLMPETRERYEREQISELTRKHLSFHNEMTRIARCLEAGDFSSAGSLMQTGSEFQRCSHALAMAVTALDRAVPLRIPVPAGRAGKPPAEW